MSHQSTAFQKALWAIDPLVKDKSFQEVTAEVLRALGKQMKLSIEPVSVLLEAQIPHLIGPAHTTSDFQMEVTRTAQEWLTAKKISGMEPPKVLLEKELSVRAAVLQLVKYAKDNHFDVIACSTHAKDRGNGKELGTFAETLFFSSNTTVLFVSPRSMVPERFSSLFFPTDLSPVSLRGLDWISLLAKEANIPVTVFHKVDPSPKGMIEFTHDAIARTKFFENESTKRNEILKTLASRFKDQGIAVEVILEPINGTYISQSILSRVGKDSLVAMVSSTSDGKHSLPGSVTRQVIRGAKNPVFVLPPN